VSKRPPGSSWSTARAVAVAQPSDADATRGRRLHELVGGRGLAYAIVLGSAAAFLAGAYLHSLPMMAAGPLLVAAIVAVAAFAIADRRAEEDFFTAFAAARGFSHLERAALLPFTPLLGAGDRRHCEHYMEGPLGSPGAPSCGLGHYVFEVHKRGEHNVSRWVSHDFTICVVDLEQGISLFPGIFLTRRRGLFGFLDGEHWLSRTNRHEVELESAELCERYDLLVDDGQDEVRLRELFAPSFVAWLAEHPLEPCFEYRAGTLVVYLERKLDDAGHLDWMLEATAEIAARFAREVEEQRPVQALKPT
jgi:hypothetical protein